MTLTQPHDSTDLSAETSVVSGVHITRMRTAKLLHTTPLLLVHGGLHASWCWELYQPYFAARGWDTYALDWYQHGQSDSLPTDRFLSRRIDDVAEEIGHAAGILQRPPAVVAHSMGALASLVYLQTRPVAAAALITPALPGWAEAEPVEVPIDTEVAWGPPSLDMAKALFFQDTADDDVERHHGRLTAESPAAVLQATRSYDARVEERPVDVPLLVIGAELDRLSPPGAVSRLATSLGGDFELAAGRGHGLLLDRRWEETAALVERWLARATAGPA